MQILKPEYKRVDTRGCLTQISTDTWKQINYIEIKKQKSFGGHYHRYKKELFYVIAGRIRLTISIPGKSYENWFVAGDCFLIEPYDKHTLYALHDSRLIEMLSEPYSKEDTLIE